MNKPWTNKIVGHGEVSPDQLLASPKNWRIHPKHQQEALAGVIGDVGFIRSITVNQRTGYVLDGHLRVALALQTGQTTIPVEYVDLSEEEEAEALATIDPIAALAVADKAQLDSLLREITTGDAAVMAMLADLAQEAGIMSPAIEDGAGGDDFDTAIEEGPTRTQLGDLWQLGRHRLLVGDCKASGSITRLTDGVTVNMILTDPPYGMRLDADFSGMKNNLRFAQEKGVYHGRKYNNIIGDHEDFDATWAIEFFDDVMEQFWFGADYYALTLGDTMHSGAWLVWDKRLEENADKMFGSCFELIFSRQKHKRDIIRHKWAGVFGTEKEPQRGRVHPNQKPVALLEDLQYRYSEENALIMDLYLGSGTTIIAAERTKRRCYGCEIEPRYADVILRRWEAESGAKAALLDRIKADG